MAEEEIARIHLIYGTSVDEGVEVDKLIQVAQEKGHDTRDIRLREIRRKVRGVDVYTPILMNEPRQ